MTTVGGGSNREWLRPLVPRKNDYGEEDVIGTHRMGYEALNVRNPQPGFRYYYSRRDPSSVQRFMNKGYQVVTSGMAEKWGSDLPEDIQQELDGVRAFKDVMLMRISDKNYRVMQEEKLRIAKLARDGATQSYLDKGSEREAQLGVNAPADDLYYKRGRHGTSQ